MKHFLTKKTLLLLWFFASVATFYRLEIQAAAAVQNFPGDLPPLLLVSDPSSGTSQVSLSSSIAFTFSKPMAPTFDIIWSSNVVAANFGCSWSEDQTTLTCHYNTYLPPNSIITWSLNPASFTDTNGMPILEFNASGNFSTVPDATSLCLSTNSSSVLSLFKSVEYEQTGELPAITTNLTFSGSILSPTNNPITALTVQTPGNVTSNFVQNPFIDLQFLYFDVYPAESALDAVYPAGAYQLSVTRTDNTNAMVGIGIPSSTEVPAPQISNFGETQTIDSSQDFVLQWVAFSGATATDSIFLSINGEAGTFNYYAPDPCVPRELPVTASSITLPRDLLKPGQTYNCVLIFSRTSQLSGLPFPDLSVTSGLHKRLQFKIKTIGGGSGEPIAPVLGQPQKLADGSFKFQISAEVGRTVSVEQSLDLATWTFLFSTNTTAASFEYTDTTAPDTALKFYRAKSQ